jgi:tetratricopeptide (TPR) repeat protein
MFNNIKNLINEIVQTVKDTDFKDVYNKTISNTQQSFSGFKHKITHLFETNLQNGLTHYYSGHYNDALMRFKLMNNMWKNNPIVYYNLGRVYFMSNKSDKAKSNLEKALTLSPKNSLSKLVHYYLNKINNASMIGFIPETLKKEFYDYSLQSIISDYSIHANDLKKIFDIYK